MDGGFPSGINEVSAEDREDKEYEEYLALYAVFVKFLHAAEGDTKEQLFERLAELRSDFLVDHAVKGFNMTMDQALELIHRHNENMTEQENEQRKILVAAIDNLIDFAVAEEFQMTYHLPDDYDADNEDDLEECEMIFDRYNDSYAGVEDKDVEYAMAIAAWWAAHSENVNLIYMTQGDSRVRPWHRELEGLTYPKREFPEWLIPPIEYGCRCFLLEESDLMASSTGVTDVQAVVSKPIKMPDFISPVFRESVAKGGRIFSEAHSYFSIPKGHKRRLKKLSKKLKDKWFK